MISIAVKIVLTLQNSNMIVFLHYIHQSNQTVLELIHRSPREGTPFANRQTGDNQEGHGTPLVWHHKGMSDLLYGRFQYFSDARMWTQHTPQKLDIVAAVSSLYLNNVAR